MFRKISATKLPFLVAGGVLLIIAAWGLFYYFEERFDFEQARKKSEETTEELRERVKEEKEKTQELLINPFAPSGRGIFRQNPPRYVKETINGFVTAIDGDRYLRATYPRGGEIFCLGSPVGISWESRGLKTVTISVRETGQGLGPSLMGNSYYLGVYPASYNERGENDGSGDVPWKAGDITNDPSSDPSSFSIMEGKVYDIIISSVIDESTKDARVIDDATDGVFSLIRCEG